MTEEEVIPAMDPNWPPMFGEKTPADRHRVKGHDRVLPPRPLPPEDPNQPTLDLGLPPRQTPGPRSVPVRPHTRRNPRPKERPMDSLTPHPTPTGVEDLERQAHARATDPSTSHLAAATVNLTKRQIQVLEAFRDKERAFRESPGANWGRRPILEGFTDEEMVEYAQGEARLMGSKVPSPSGLRTARKALTDAGLIDHAPDRRLRKTALGNDAFVWVLTQAGRDFDLGR